MLPRFLLDTHVLLRWFGDAARLSREQARVLQSAARRSEPIALSAFTLLEIAVLYSGGKIQLQAPLEEFFNDLQSQALLRVLPISFEIAAEVASLGSLRDPADRTIVATARVHRLRLVTSDQRIIESALVPVVA
jgi:PIN domain nuclease of toxin-antitoxin system